MAGTNDLRGGERGLTNVTTNDLRGGERGLTNVTSDPSMTSDPSDQRPQG